MRRQSVLFALGILLCAIGVVLMVEGSVLGKRTTGIATVLTLAGICLIGTSGARLFGHKKA